MRSSETSLEPALLALLTFDDSVPNARGTRPQDAIIGPGFFLQGSAHAVSADGQVAAVLCGTADAAHPGPGGSRLSGAEAILAAFLANEDPQRIAGGLTGNQACVVVDSNRRRLLAVGDRMGIRRLYYSRTRNEFRVATDLSWIAEGTGSTEISRQAIYDYVYFHVIPAPKSALKGIDALPIGSSLSCDHEQLDIRRHRQEKPRSRTSDLQSAVSEAGRLLKDAVAKALPEGDRQTACFLSGGLDSSSVAGFAAQILGGENVHAFSIGFGEKAYDESEFAEAAAKTFGLNWHRHELTPSEVVNSIEDIAGAMPEPFGNSSAVAVYHCALQARKAGFDFMLAGDGGDEIFGGNARYAKQFVFERYSRIPAFLRTGLLEPGVRAALSGTGLSLLRKAQSYIEQAKVPLPDRLQSYNYLHRNQLSDVFSAAFLQDINPDEPLEMLREEYRSCSSDEPLDRMLQLDWRFTLHDNDLVKVNSMCRLAGTDVAYPMLDRQLVDFACQLPTDWKIRRGDLRWFYRTAMRGFLPDLIIDKEKHGFGLPFGVWTRTHDDLRGIAESSVAALSKRGIFQDEFLKDTLQKHRDVHAGYYGELIWILMILEIWLQKHAPDVGV